MLEKETYFLKIRDEENPGRFGLGECPVFRGLSAEDTPDYTERIVSFCNNFSPDSIPPLSSLIFGVESALADMELRDSDNRTGRIAYRINGLIWMGDKKKMLRRIGEKLDSGFKCLKLKIGGIDFADELDLLRFIRTHFSPEVLELRLDANGAFTPENAPERLKRLSQYNIHSIEQPIKAGQLEAMRDIVAGSPIDVALDEELIGVSDAAQRSLILDTISPDYIILKPSLCGGFSGADRWIADAESRGIGWWATSALESNMGLTAIALWLRKYSPERPQGLGTGGLYINNVSSPLRLDGETLSLDLADPLPELPEGISL